MNLGYKFEVHAYLADWGGGGGRDKCVRELISST